MGDARLWIMTVVLVTSSVTSQQNQRSLQDLNLSKFELALIRAIGSAPGDENIGRSGQDWNIVRSVSGESQANQRELDVIRKVGDAIPGDTNGGGYGADWSIVKSISSELYGSQFQYPNTMGTSPLSSAGGSIGVPILDPVPEQCPVGYYYDVDTMSCLMINTFVAPSGGGAIDVPLLDQPRMQCPLGEKFVRRKCRKWVR